MKKKTLMLVLASCMTANAVANDSPAIVQSDTQEHTFYGDKERGWYWYETNPETGEEEMFFQPTPESKPVVVPRDPNNSQPSQQAKKPEDVPLSQAWFRENFEKYRDYAIENPEDREAMRTYLYLEKYMRDRATKFAYARQEMVYADPYLDATTNRATANFGMKDMNIAATENKQHSLTQLGESTGVFFFYRSDCPFCKRQMPLLKIMEERYGFTIKPISLDGQPLPDSPWEDYLVDSGQARQLGVLKVPAMYLYEPQSQSVELIAQGLQSLPQLETRTVLAAHRVGLMTEEDVKLTRPVGLYPDINGNITGAVEAPNNAPEEFKELFNKATQTPSVKPEWEEK